jgi:hypothetical protein
VEQLPGDHSLRSVGLTFLPLALQVDLTPRGRTCTHDHLSQREKACGQLGSHNSDPMSGPGRSATRLGRGVSRYDRRQVRKAARTEAARLLASGSLDRTVRLWNVASHLALARALAADGSRFVHAPHELGDRPRHELRVVGHREVAEPWQLDPLGIRKQVSQALGVAR